MNNKDFISYDWFPYLRNFKLGIVTGDIELNVSQSILKKFESQLEFIKDEFPNDIITGSLALNLFGLLDREISDIDIMIKDVKRYSGYKTGMYYHMMKGTEVDLEKRIGYLNIKHRKTGLLNKLFPKKYKVDFFKDEFSNYIEVEHNKHIYKLQNPIDILETKIKLNGVKHYRDLYCILV
jgi:hypothetical protein